MYGIHNFLQHFLTGHVLKRHDKVQVSWSLEHENWTLAWRYLFWKEDWGELNWSQLWLDVSYYQMPSKLQVIWTNQFWTKLIVLSQIIMVQIWSTKLWDCSNPQDNIDWIRRRFWNSLYKDLSKSSLIAFNLVNWNIKSSVCNLSICLTVKSHFIDPKFFPRIACGTPEL